MKNILTIFITGILVLLFNSQISAFDFLDETGPGGVGYMAEAMEHAETAKSHKAHPKHIHDHAKESLEYVKKAQIEAIEHGNIKGRKHITAAIQHLVKAIEHADIGHAHIASEYVADALEDMRQFMIQ